MEPLIELLQAINNGLLTLKPLGNSEKEMNDFQSVVKLLKYAEGKGLITKIKIHTESRTSHGWHDLALVQGGLTIEGMEYLNNFSVEDEPKANINEDIIELKPNFMGIGININALIRWFKK
jgi:hypothetical protein